MSDDDHDRQPDLAPVTQLFGQLRTDPGAMDRNDSPQDVAGPRDAADSDDAAEPDDIAAPGADQSGTSDQGDAAFGLGDASDLGDAGDAEPGDAFEHDATDAPNVTVVAFGADDVDRSTDAGGATAAAEFADDPRGVHELPDGTVALPWRASGRDDAERVSAEATSQSWEGPGASDDGTSRDSFDGTPGDSFADEQPGEPASFPTRDEALLAAEARILKRLRRGDRSRGELRHELAGDELLDADGIEQLLDKLADLGYIDDARMAESLADKLFDRRGKGIEGVRRELRQRMLDDESIAAALDGRDRDDEFERAAGIAETRAERLRGVDRETAVRRLTAFLQRRGFGSGVSLIAANNALDGTGGTSRKGGAATKGDSGAASRVYFGNTTDE